jgi:hypothetical protein
LLIFAVAAHDISMGEFFFNGDEEAHAVTGLYFKDVYRTMPFRNLMSFTFNYYAQYPALGIAHWPPLFYVVEGFAFLVGGPSVISARLTTLAFMIVALLYFYALAKSLLNERTALISMLFLGLMPTMLLFEKLVMLEVPCLAFCLACAFHTVRYIEKRRTSDLYFSSFAAALALLTKQNAVFLPLFVLLYVLSTARSRIVFSVPVIIRWIALPVLIAGPYYALIAWVHWKTIALELREDRVSSLTGAISYVSVLPSQTGLILLICAIAGFVVLLLRRQHRALAFSVTWIASTLLAMSCIGHKEPRYVMYWLPAFALLAAAPFGVRTSARFEWPRVVAAALVLSVITMNAAKFERPYVAGYKQVAEQLTKRISDGVILVDDLDGYGTLIFFANVMDTRRKLFFHRKALYAVRWKESMGYTNLVNDPGDIDRIVDDYGIAYIVHAENAPIRFEGQRVLRDYLRRGRFAVVSRVPLETNQPAWKDRQIALYKNQSPTAAVAKMLRIKNLHLNEDIVIPFPSER